MTNERFWEKVDKSGGLDACWLWTGRPSSDGYGQFRDGKRTVRSHRYVYEQTYGALPKFTFDSRGLVVRHICHVRLCCNPNHLLIGFPSDNSRDMAEAGRAASGDRNTSRKNAHLQVRGEQAHRAKLDPNKVHEIRTRRATGETLEAIGRRFGVSKNSIYAIVHRKSWAHIP